YCSYWDALAKCNDTADRVQLSEYMLRGIEEVFASENEEGFLLCSELAKPYGIPCDKTKFIQCVEAIKINIEEDILELRNSDPEIVLLLAMLNAILNSTYDIQEVYEELKSGRGEILEDYFLIDGIDNPMVLRNKRLLFEWQDRYYKALVDVFEEAIKGDFVKKDRYIDAELKEFSRIFNDESATEKRWDYLSKRLGCKSIEVDLLFKNRNEIEAGAYTNTVFKKDDEHRFIIAKLLAIRQYVNFLIRKGSSDNESAGKMAPRGSQLYSRKSRGAKKKFDDLSLDKRFHNEQLLINICKRLCTQVFDTPPDAKYDPMKKTYTWLASIRKLAALAHAIEDNKLLKRTFQLDADRGRCYLSFFPLVTKESTKRADKEKSTKQFEDKQRKHCEKYVGHYTDLVKEEREKMDKKPL
ncbi:MAG: hypothetical protein WBM13_06305, partial [Bacteroidia bacterium]